MGTLTLDVNHREGYFPTVKFEDNAKQKIHVGNICGMEAILCSSTFPSSLL